MDSLINEAEGFIDDEAPETAVETVRRGLEFLAQRPLDPEEAALLARHGLLNALGAGQGKIVAVKSPRQRRTARWTGTSEDEREIFYHLSRMNIVELQQWMNEVISLALRAEIKIRRRGEPRVDVSRARPLLSPAGKGGK